MHLLLKKCEFCSHSELCTTYGSQKKKEIFSLNSIFGFHFPVDTEYVSVNVKTKGQMSAVDKLLGLGFDSLRRYGVLSLGNIVFCSGIGPCDGPVFCPGNSYRLSCHSVRQSATSTLVTYKEQAEDVRIKKIDGRQASDVCRQDTRRKTRVKCVKLPVSPKLKNVSSVNIFFTGDIIY